VNEVALLTTIVPVEDDGKVPWAKRYAERNDGSSSDLIAEPGELGVRCGELKQ